MGFRFDQEQCRNIEFSSRHEWLLTNGAGAFAMGTISGLNTRRYHGHLFSCDPDTLDRTLLLSSIECSIQADGNPVALSTNQYPGAIFPEGYQFLESFEVDNKAIWRWKAWRCRLEKVLWLVHHENAAVIEYRNTGEAAFTLILRPLVAHRSYHGEFHERADYPQRILFDAQATAVIDDPTPLRIEHKGAERMPVQGWYYRFEHTREMDRGLQFREDLFCPCELRYHLEPGSHIQLLVNTFEGMDLKEPEGSPTGSLGSGLTASAQSFLIDKPGHESIIAGYPWFTSWGRDTMIALPGLCLHTGRIELARKILMRYAEYLHQGLIPNRFIENGAADYNTSDASLWFVQALYATLESEWDSSFAEFAHECIKNVLHWHRKGTLFGIHVDLDDGLLTQGEEGEQLTWMDAKIGDWVVTPRHGKPVEINGLWINALWAMAWLCKKLGKQSWRYEKAAAFAEGNFEKKFWCASRGHYFDTVDPADASLRPNQLIAMSLPFGPAKGEKAQQALKLIERELLTPFGLRTLGPSEPGYKGRFEGPMPELDAAYHQGTVWPWLMGPYVTAFSKLGGDKAEAKRILRQAREMLTDYGIGGLAEVYDGDAPHRANGCPWQAWSIGEWLRAWKENADGD